MSIDSALFYAFLLVFVRCSAMLMSSPMFGAQNTPVIVRGFTCLSISAALTFAVKSHIGPPPADMYTFVLSIAHELLAGLLIGGFVSMVLHAAQMAGAFLDLQMGLGLSQALNPITGVPVSLLAQFKFFLCLVVFLSINAHHVMLNAFVHSYDAMPTPTMEMLPAIKDTFVNLITQMSLLALQIAAPVAAVSIVVDAALGVINKAVPQMQTMVVGLPAKLLMGLLALSVTLPALASSVQYGVEATTNSIASVFQAPPTDHGRQR
jgi:flagellar biosynthetic protein FliR